MLTRHFSAERVNEVVNHPSIYPYVRGFHTEPLDVTAAIANHANIFLVGEYGCVFFIKHQPGIYEFHTSVLPEGRGEWMMRGARFAFDWMFTRTDAFELMTKCPHGNVPAKAGAKAVGCSPRFTTRAIWPWNDKLVPIDIYSIILQEWIKAADNFRDGGKTFHKSLDMQYTALGKPLQVHEEDEVHDRYVGATVEMIRYGQARKAISFYNRWAVMSDYKSVSIASNDPLIIDIDEARLLVENNDFRVM